MDNQNSHIDDTLNLSLQGIAIRPNMNSSRPSSARRNSQSKQPQTPTSSREGSAKDRPTNMSASLNLSASRLRRLSNSSQRSIGRAPSPAPPDIKKSTTVSASSSVFHVISPRPEDADGFFTDQSQAKSDDAEWDETRRWVDELHQLNSSFTRQQPTHPIGQLGMSRDSLNGTIQGNLIPPLNDYRDERPLPIIISNEPDMETENAATKIQRWYRKNNARIKPKNFERKPILEEDIPTRDEETPRASPRIVQEQEKNASGRASSRRSSLASNASKGRRTPIVSSRPPSARSDTIKRTSASSIASSSTSSSKVTLDDVYETLKKLEQVEQFPVQPPLDDDSAYILNRSAPATPRAQTTPRVETDQYDRIVASVHSQRSISRESLNRFTTPPHSPSLRQQQSPRATQSVSVPQHRSLLSSSSSSSSIDEQAQKPPISSKSLIASTHTLTPRSTINFDGDFDYQLQIQKLEYEATIQRHLKFIDQLIDDKKKLSTRCELLVSELKTIDRKCNDRIRSIEESHRKEIQELKDTYESAEKNRRERWIEEKTRKIKELTVQGLEPEIQKLINKHKNELTKLKTVHEAELLAADERASQRYIRMVEELRDQLEREKQVAIDRERELAKEKYEKSLRAEEQSFHEQRRRLYAEIEEEKNRQTEIATKQRVDIDKLRRDIEENHRTVVDSTKLEYEAIRLEQERRHINEINELNEKLKIEKQNWEENYMRQQETILANRERQMREQMKHERDKEIEKIIAQLESDTTSTKEETERTAENRVKRIRDKYETELQEMETTEKQTREKYSQTKAQLIELQGEYERLKMLLQQKDNDINDIKKITDTLQQERERLSDIIRQEFADRLVMTDEENHRVKNEIAELRARQQLELEKKKEELEAIQKQQEKELETIQERIKQAITKKDEQVQGLRVQYEAAVKRAEHLESLLAQQRKIISSRPASGTNASKKGQTS